MKISSQIPGLCTINGVAMLAMLVTIIALVIWIQRDRMKQAKLSLARCGGDDLSSINGYLEIIRLEKISSAFFTVGLSFLSLNVVLVALKLLNL